MKRAAIKCEIGSGAGDRFGTLAGPVRREVESAIRRGVMPLQRNAHWSAYYRQNERTPEKTTELSPWVASRYKRVGPKITCSSCGGTGSYKGRGLCRACDSTGKIG